MTVCHRCHPKTCNQWHPSVQTLAHDARCEVCGASRCVMYECGRVGREAA